MSNIGILSRHIDTTRAAWQYQNTTGRLLNEASNPLTRNEEDREYTAPIYVKMPCWHCARYNCGVRGHRVVYRREIVGPVPFILHGMNQGYARYA